MRASGPSRTYGRPASVHRRRPAGGGRADAPGLALLRARRRTAAVRPPDDDREEDTDRRDEGRGRMSNPYEALRDSATGEAGEAWKAADREAKKLATPYQELREDPRHTDEHK